MNMQFMMMGGHRYRYDDITIMKCTLMNKICQQKINKINKITMKKLKYNNSSTLLIFGYIRNVGIIPFDIIQLLFAYFYDQQSSFWDIVNGNNSIYIIIMIL